MLKFLIEKFTEYLSFPVVMLLFMLSVGVFIVINWQMGPFETDQQQLGGIFLTFVFLCTLYLLWKQWRSGKSKLTRKQQRQRK